MKWIKNWLNGRSQRVILNGVFSEWTEVLSGCVQGSILGPLIALCLLDTVDDHISFCKVSKFADDNKFYGTIKSNADYENMQADIENITKWAKDWGFVLNSGKCQILQFGGKDYYDFKMDGKIVNRANIARDLGVVVDTKLNFHENIKSVVGKAKRRAFCTSRALLLKTSTSGSLCIKLISVVYLNLV